MPKNLTMMTLDDYSEQILKPTLKNLFDDPKFVDNLIFVDVKPLTRWQRFKFKMADYKQRAKDIWTILRGRDIHEDCCW